jgi:hypothetical protein
MTDSAKAGGRFRSITMIVIFDIAAPLVAYKLLRSAGMTTVTALVLSGLLPALRVAYGLIRHRRLDVVAALVLGGIVVGTVLGLVTHSARLVLVEGSVPTAVFGVACLSSLAAQPLIYSMAVEFAGRESARGREMTRLWQFEGYRRIFRIITAVWGVGFLVEAGLRVVIVYSSPIGTTLAISKVMPFVFVAILITWTLAYGNYRKKKGERLAAVGGGVIEESQPQVPSDRARW